MRRSLALIAAVMLVLTLWSGIQSSAAYAGEMRGVSTMVEGTPAGHTAGDADEVSGDADKATPHHHSLSHDHGVALPARDLAAVLFPSLTPPVRRASFAPPTAIAQYRDLRPPIV